MGSRDAVEADQFVAECLKGDGIQAGYELEVLRVVGEDIESEV
jgi:hypothetical protein